jgi:cellulose synthase/poly-beta-1,6-N-acetylglucosamine synthase-like glycosyltransferase
MSRAPAASVVVTTYNNPRYLELVLLGYARQDRRDFEVVVADDGSRPDTKALLDRMRPTFPVPLVHAWQDDIGFRQARVMNWGAPTCWSSPTATACRRRTSCRGTSPPPDRGGWSSAAACG